MLNYIEEHVNNNQRTETCEKIFFCCLTMLSFGTHKCFLFKDEKIYAYMMELIALMASNCIDTTELEKYLSLFKTNNPPLVRPFWIPNKTQVNY